MKICDDELPCYDDELPCYEGDDELETEDAQLRAGILELQTQAGMPVKEKP